MGRVQRSKSREDWVSSLTVRSMKKLCGRRSISWESNRLLERQPAPPPSLMGMNRRAMVRALGLAAVVLWLIIFSGVKARASGPICSVPGDYATIQGAVNDIGCTTINV